MRVTRKSKLHVRAQNIIFTALLLGAAGLLAWLSSQYVWQVDWTAGNRNTLSAASRELLATLDKPVNITAYAREDQALRRQIEELVERYRRHKPDVRLEFINPDTSPGLAREAGITTEGELVVSYGGGSEHVRRLEEEALSSALLRLARGGERRALFITGHGERAPQGRRNFDLGNLGRELAGAGFSLDSLNLATAGAVPEDAALVVIAGPQTDYLPAEVQALKSWLARGGNLLWLAEPGTERHGLGPLAEQLGIEFLPGVIVDATSQLFGVQDPSMVLVPEYPASPVVRDFAYLTVFPQAAGLRVREDAKNAWQADPFLRSLPRSWLETGELAGTIRYEADQGDREGPITLGLALTRPEPGSGATAAAQEPTEKPAEPARRGEQRVIVIGDGDFLANAWLGNGGNLDLGLRIFNWLSGDDAQLEIPARRAPDTRLDLSPGEIYLIAGVFLLALPLGLLGTGIVVWLRRRRR